MIHEHTPGPWEVGRGYARTHSTPIRWKGENLAWICGMDSAHEFSLEQTLANARLISAAPDMLAALEGLLSDNYLADPINADRMAEARAAIAKAKGKGAE